MCGGASAAVALRRRVLSWRELGHGKSAGRVAIMCAVAKIPANWAKAAAKDLLAKSDEADNCCCGRDHSS